MNQFPFRLLSIYMAIGLAGLFALDEITLKNGDLIKGKMDDKRETETEVQIDVSTIKGITDYKTVLKADIASTKRSDGAEEPALQVVLPPDSVEIKWYDEQIEKVFKPWLAKFPQSPLAVQIQQKVTDFTTERDRVKNGDTKMGDKWYTRTEFEEVRIDIDAIKFLNDMKDLAARKDYSELLKMKPKMLPYKTSDHFDKIVGTFLDGFKDFQTGGYEKIVQKQVSDLEYTIVQNEKWIRESINEKIPTVGMASDDTMEWNTLRSSGPLEAARKQVGSTVRSYTFVDENRFLVRFGEEYYQMSNLLPEWNRADSAVDEFLKDFKSYYNDYNAPKYRLSSSKMADMRRLLQGMQDAKEKIKTVKKESDNIGQFEDRVTKAVAELEGLRVESLNLAKASVTAALSAHARRDFNVTNSELRSASQAWPGLISIDRAVKQIAVDYFADSKANIEKGEFDKAVENLNFAKQIIPLAKTKLMSLVVLKTDINKYMTENKQMIDLLKKQEAEQKKKDQEIATLTKKFDSDFNRGDYMTISKANLSILVGTEQQQTYEGQKKTAEDNMAKSKELVQQVRPFIQTKKFMEANNTLTEARTVWPQNPALADLSVLLAEAMRPKTFMDTLEENLMVSVAIFLTVFLGIAYGVAKYLSK